MNPEKQQYRNKALEIGDQIATALALVEPETALYHKLLNTRMLLDKAIIDFYRGDWTIAFMGRVGVGKTSALCHLLGLQTPKGEVLNTGSGRTTVCEVELRFGSEPKIEAVPATAETIHAYLEEFTQYLAFKQGDSAEGSGAGVRPSSEIERALRNMLNLPVKLTKTPAGKVLTTDHAADLLVESGDARRFMVALQSRINLEARQQTRFAPALEDQSKLLDWIKTTFSALNNGLNASASLPEKIIITLNLPFFADLPGDLCLLDTKGIDDTANRADLAEKMNSRRTLNVLCTGFNDAPDKATQSLLELAVKGGQSKYLADETLLLVLDRPGDAENVIGVDEPVGDIELGRAIRQEQVEQQIQQTLKLSDVAIQFHNMKQDDTAPVLMAIADQLMRLQARIYQEIDGIAESVSQLSEQAKRLGENPDLETVRATIEPWLYKASGSVWNQQSFFETVAREVRVTHLGSVRASVNRWGSWYNLDVYHVVAQACRSQLVRHFEPNQAELMSLLDNLQQRLGEKSGATGLVHQIRATLDVEIQKIYEQGAALATLSLDQTLKQDGEFWYAQQREWGKGPGYKDRIADGTVRWAVDKQFSESEVKIKSQSQALWNYFLDEVAAMAGVGFYSEAED
ncbi:hypothetical protein [Endozoicomonas ascidiicola]|uniref:hypothetical protein n=1 Tax=Endozoicomonas ascidiicola TaxID=1698521 RepID=UPI000830BA31|nr:hypothetical protein [Endozoicomonas ascidiicola]